MTPCMLINRHHGSAEADEPYCGSGGYPEGVTMVTLCVSHEAGHALFEDDAEYDMPYDDETEMAAIGTVGSSGQRDVRVRRLGLRPLYRNSGTKMERIDSFAVPEALDPAYAFGFGDLSIHEFATDPGAQHRLQRVLRGRAAGVQVRRVRPRRRLAPTSTRAATTSGASSSSPRRQEEADRRERPRPRPLPVPVHGQEVAADS